MGEAWPLNLTRASHRGEGQGGGYEGGKSSTVHTTLQKESWVFVKPAPNTEETT